MRRVLTHRPYTTGRFWRGDPKGLVPGGILSRRFTTALLVALSLTVAPPCPAAARARQLAPARIGSSIAGTAPATPSAAALLPTTFRPYVQVRADLEKLAGRVAIEPAPTLVDRPLARDYRDHSLVAGYRASSGSYPESLGLPAFPTAYSRTRWTYQESYLSYRRAIGRDLEAGLVVPWLQLKESRPTRIYALASPPFFAVADDVRTSEGLGDLRFSLARAWNRPGLSRRLKLEFKPDTAHEAAPGAPELGTGQQDYALSYAAKRTRGSFALSAEAGARLRREAIWRSDGGGTAVAFDRGDELFATVRGDRRLRDCLTASLVLEAWAAGRDAWGGVELAGSSSRELAVTPTLTWQASEVLEAIAQVRIPVVTHGLVDEPLMDVALRWRN